ncbi:hypothetical protein ONZ43_g3515 [Nemania bipapillata]|uniref:Uncharacterized protein n=1 Tax=Nemania bipapillata TaxID=110536 RepID=A0ACC2IWV1_9PEZI|nr:hypothetical protein ONZ43_g3515 [Nemania bipapillata]
MDCGLPPRPLISSSQSEYHAAIQFYYEVRDNNILKEAEEIGGRSFVLVSNVTAVLKEHGCSVDWVHGHISRLLETAYGRFNYQPSLQKSYQILDRLPIFYTLLDLDLGHNIHKFVEYGITKLPVDLPKLREVLPAGERGDNAEKFYKQQWRWCAMNFEWRMSRKAPSHEQIVPITARTKIEPTRDGLPKTDRRASLWVVEVPTSFVDEEIQRRLRSPDEETAATHEIDSRYRFVVKRYSQKRKDEFENEKNIYNTIDEKKGIVQWIGWYTHCEKDPGSNTETTYYNLVLELGDQDLYSAFQKENPPITFSEIQIFWKSMFNVADALAWHGDIKPENILDVRGSFKLADPGSRFPEVPEALLSAAAAPEKFTYRPERLVEPEVTQGSDIWSLGCVFSVAATYVVLGKEGVKQYRLLRQSMIEKLGIGIGDPFHNKEKVLPVVTDWHRISGADLSQELMAIDEEAIQSTDRFPEYIAAFIDDVTHTGKSSISELEDVPRTISKSGTELFSEELLYPSRRSEGRPISRLVQSGREDRLRGIGIGVDPNPVLIIPERVSGFFTQEQRALTSLGRNPQEAPAKPPDPPTTFWEVEADMEEFRVNQKDYLNLTNHLRGRKSVYGKPLGGKEDQLKHHFNNRDLVYLVDNASSMRSFWGHATYLLKVLVMRSIGYDDNGMELRFTNETEEKWRLRPKKKQTKDDFLRKMGEASPNKRKNVVSKTDMSASLSLILEEHLRNNSDGSKLKRHLTILVLTDGLWEQNREYAVDDYLVTYIKKIPEENWEPEIPPGTSSPSNKPASRPRPISIQFIRFGHHPKAIERLDRLDNQLKDRPELAGTSIPDIIDTEDANMDVYKMFLGSFIEDFDNKAIQGAPGVGSTSVPSVTSPTSGLEISGTSLSDYETTQSPIHAPQTPTSARTYPSDQRHLSLSHFPWPSPPHTQRSRVTRTTSLSIPDSTTQGLGHHRHESSEYVTSARVSGPYGQYPRPRGQSQGQHSMNSSPLTQNPPYDYLSPG